jgi:hypothetical protein
LITLSYLGSISMSLLSSPPWSVLEGVQVKKKYRAFSELKYALRLNS